MRKMKPKRIFFWSTAPLGICWHLVRSVTSALLCSAFNSATIVLNSVVIYIYIVIVIVIIVITRITIIIVIIITNNQKHQECIALDALMQLLFLFVAYLLLRDMAIHSAMHHITC